MHMSFASFLLSGGKKVDRMPVMRRAYSKLALRFESGNVMILCFPVTYTVCVTRLLHDMYVLNLKSDYRNERSTRSSVLSFLEPVVSDVAMVSGRYVLTSTCFQDAHIYDIIITIVLTAGGNLSEGPGFSHTSYRMDFVRAIIHCPCLS